MPSSKDQLLDLIMQCNDLETLKILAEVINSKIRYQEEIPSNTEAHVTNPSINEDISQSKNTNFIFDENQISRLSKKTQKCQVPYPSIPGDDLTKGKLSELTSRDFSQFIIKNNEGACSFKTLENSFSAWINTTDIPVEFNAGTLRTWLSRWKREDAISYVPGYRGNYTMTKKQARDAEAYNPFIKQDDEE